MAWEPDRRSNFFFSPPAHLCAVTYMTEISLIVTLNKQFNSTQLNVRCFGTLTLCCIGAVAVCRNDTWPCVGFVFWLCSLLVLWPFWRSGAQSFRQCVGFRLYSDHSYLSIYLCWCLTSCCFSVLIMILLVLWLCAFRVLTTCIVGAPTLCFIGILTIWPCALLLERACSIFDLFVLWKTQSPSMWHVNV